MEFLRSLEPSLVQLLGIDVDPRALTPLQVSARAVVIYLVGLLILRVGENRFLGRHTSFDIILAFLLGALLSRSVNGSSPFLPTIVAVGLLVAVHWVFGWMAARWSGLGSLLRGKSIPLVRGGRMDEGAMQRRLINRSDLREAMRLAGHPGEAPIAYAYLERNGSISVVPEAEAGDGDGGTTRHRREGDERRDRVGSGGAVEAANGGGALRVVEVDVADGVQTVRLVLG